MTDHPEFDKWWSEEGEFIRAGGGQYEISFAFGAWNAARERAIEECAKVVDKFANSATDNSTQFILDICSDDIRALKEKT